MPTLYYKGLSLVLKKEIRLIKLGVRLLSEYHEYLFYKKYGKSLEDNYKKPNLTQKERILISKAIKRNLTLNITFIESLNLTDEEIESLITADKKTIVKLKNQCYRYISIGTPGKYSDFLSSFQEPEYLVKLALLILKEKERKIIYKKYGKDLNNVLSRNMSQKEKDLVNYFKSKLKNILLFLKQEDIKENEIDSINIEELKRKYYLQSRKDYNSLFSYFDCEKCYVRLSLLFQTKNAQELMQNKYGKDLTNTTNQGISNSKNQSISNFIIPKMKKAIAFLKENNISEKECEYLLSEEGKEDLLILINMYNKIYFINRYVTNKLNNLLNNLNESSNHKEISKYGLEKAKLILLFKKYEGFITIQKIGELLGENTEEVFDTYITYKLEQIKTRR